MTKPKEPIWYLDVGMPVENAGVHFINVDKIVDSCNGFAWAISDENGLQEVTYTFFCEEDANKAKQEVEEYQDEEKQDIGECYTVVNKAT